MVNCAITDKSGYVKFNDTGTTGSKISKIGFDVESLTFRDLFKKYNVPTLIDYMSLDIEGHESLALEQFPFESHKCLLITVEHNLYDGGPENKNKIKKILIENDYIIKEENIESDGLPFEDWYIHKSFIE